MGTDNLTTLRAAVRAELADTSTDFTNAIIDQAVANVVSDISRISPREQLHVEVLHSRTVTEESFTSDHDAWVSLTYKPIDRTQTITVTNNAGTTEYTQNTDYIIDYAQGRIQVLSSGDMADSTTHKITYERSLIGIDVSSLTDLIRIERVEIQRAQASPPMVFETFARWGDLLWLLSKDGQTQARFSENDTLYIWYMGEHSKPTTGAAGSYPAYFDDVVVKGAVAYSLFAKHRERNLQAITDLASARSALDTANDDVADVTKMDAAIADITAALDKINTTIVDGDNLLGTGDDLINQINKGADPERLYAEYARVKAALAQLRIEEGLAREREAQIYLSKGALYQEEAAHYLAAADRESQVADRFLVDARDRHQDYWQHLMSRIENAQGRSKTSTLQLPT